MPICLRSLPEIRNILECILIIPFSGLFIRPSICGISVRLHGISFSHSPLPLYPPYIELRSTPHQPSSAPNHFPSSNQACRKSSCHAHATYLPERLPLPPTNNR